MSESPQTAVGTREERMELMVQTGEGPVVQAFVPPRTVQFYSSRFGELAVPESEAFRFPTGLPGFPGSHVLALFPNPGGGCFEWLHSTSNRDLGFAVLAPDEAMVGLLDSAVASAARLLGWDGDDSIDARLIVTVPAGAPQLATVNVRAPILLNRSRAVGAQPVLNDDSLPFRLRLFPDAGRGADV